MSRDKIDVNEFVDSKSDGGIGNSDIMKALEDIDYDISQVDIDNASPDDIDGEHLKEIENDFLFNCSICLKNYCFFQVYIYFVIANNNISTKLIVEYAL